jgi:hypothetical protein
MTLAFFISIERCVMQNLVRVSKAKDLPFKPQTFYKWWHLRKHVEIFVKFGGALFVDLTALERVMEKARLKAQQ